MIQPTLPIQLPEPRQPLTTREMWRRMDTSTSHAKTQNAKKESRPVATARANTVTMPVSRQHTDSAKRHGDIVSVTR